MAVRRKRKSADSFSSLNKVELIRGGKPYFDRMLQMIGTARETIHLQTYIYASDETGTMVADALKEAVKRKVRVYLLTDGYASRTMSKTFIKELKAAGIHFRFFNNIYNFAVNHKIVIFV